MVTYYTAEIARLNHIHPNTVRLYERLGLLTPPKRLGNGYRLFTELQLEQVRLVRLALEVEVLQSGLRQQMFALLQAAAALDWESAQALGRAYLKQLACERQRAEESLLLAEGLLVEEPPEPLWLTRREMAQRLAISVETLRNWERNGLLAAKHWEQGRRMYDEWHERRLKMIRTLRQANYSLTAILRLLTASPAGDVRQIIDTPSAREEIVSICDALLTSLARAEDNGRQVLACLENMALRFKEREPPS